MLSILIPTYDYNIVPLVKELEQQALKANVSFEIISTDDGSFSVINEKNQFINTLVNCKFIENKRNLGRSGIRNLLAKKAKYNWLLFLDADVMPINKNFLLNYLNSINEDSEVIYGGIKYPDKSPSKDKLLRWNYGSKREALNVDKRLKNKYLRFLTLSFIIKKDVFSKVLFNEEIPNNRHEDTLFAYDLKKQNIKIEHIDNPVIHYGIEDSGEFLEKSLLSVESLLILINNRHISFNHTLISRIFRFSKFIFLNYFLSFIYGRFNTKIENNLLSEKPSLVLFDLYRLSYLCHLDLKK